MKLQAIRDEVIVKKIVEKETKGGIVLPDSAQKCMKAEVLSVGKKCDKHGNETSLEVEVGDTVIFPNGTGRVLEYDDETFLMLKQEDILGVLMEE
jgi:chaperonin GroES